MTIPAHFKFDSRPVASQEAIVQVPGVRITILTSRLLRIEYSPENKFEDRPSQVFWFRSLPVPHYEVKRNTDTLEIITNHLHLIYRPNHPFTPDSLSVEIIQTGKVWHFGDVDDKNLKGTGRTLDQADGPIPLEPGLISRSGWTLLDDTRSLVFNKQGWIESRDAPSGYMDLYFFGYGGDYQGCLDDFCSVSGPTPIVPRWILGNWWSHYWEYHQDELLELMYEFQKREVPLSVCIVDMDWHITQTGNECSGWTGYTWNRELFPDPIGFLQSLHNLGLKVSLNLHPAEGIHSHEEMYPEMARAVGIDPETKEPVRFDIENPDFVEPYFKILHHPKEAEGVDFWWMDWQQGNPSRIPGLNLLWWINHLHFLDLGRNGKRPFIFSRWGGLGNHRYPIGFSGDSVVSWASLAFQPYMTATAANVGFGWWSHDIGGHMRGIEDDELYVRWVQFGVFSPILRLHCTKNPFHDRRPWGHNLEAFHITRQAMQLRHALIPYLYSMSWNNYRKNISLVRPMYYQNPDMEDAYACPDQYYFGSELIVAPFVSPRDPDTRLSRQVVWLPKGDWFNFFDGRYYEGDAWYAVYGSLNDVPVFSKAGGIIPMSPLRGWGGVEKPEKLIVYVFPGADNRFDLFEDDGESQLYLQGEYVLTPIKQEWRDQKQVIEIGPCEGKLEYALSPREYCLVFYSIREPDKITLEIDGNPAYFSQSYEVDTHKLTLSGIQLEPVNKLRVELESNQPTLMDRSDHKRQDLYTMIKSFRTGTETKRHLALRIERLIAEPAELAAFQIILTPSQRRALLEVITEAGIEENSHTGDVLLILWNNQVSKLPTYQVSYEILPGSRPREFYSLEKGPVPKFRLYKPLELPSSPAVWQFDYGELLRITFPYHIENRYPRPDKGML